MCVSAQRYGVMFWSQRSRVQVLLDALYYNIHFKDRATKDSNSRLLAQILNPLPLGKHAHTCSLFSYYINKNAS